MNIGPQGIALIKSFETCRLSAYLPTPADVPTLGWGHTRAVALGDTCTQEQADAWFLEDLEWVQDCLDANIHVPITQHETDALASLCFNIGCEEFKKSTLVRLINESNFDDAGAQFLRWNKQHGKELAGLTRRRQAEKDLFEENA